MVEQLIVTAEREIIRKLPGEPYGNYLESIDLKDENDRLRTEIADLQARLGSPLALQFLSQMQSVKQTHRFRIR